MLETDIEDAVTLLARGFPQRTPQYWRTGLLRMRDRPSPEGLPRFGYILVADDHPVGIVLLISTRDDQGASRVNVSSWYVEPAYRPYASALISATLRLDDVTLLNISPDPTTYKTIETAGFKRFVQGAFLAFTAHLLGPNNVRIRQIRADDATAIPILREHASFGCLCYEVSDGDGIHPFIFCKVRTTSLQVLAVRLVYCRDIADFIRFAGPLGRRLLASGACLIVLDANERPPGLSGVFLPNRPKYFRGDRGPPRLGDLAYSEIVVFGP